VEAKLTIATLVKGAVVPKGAVLSGEVTESTAKSENIPSRLAIRMDSARWKDGSTDLKVYLTAWYYPLKSENRDQDSPYSVQSQVGITFGGSPNPYPPGRTSGQMAGAGDDSNNFPDPLPS